MDGQAAAWERMYRDAARRNNEQWGKLIDEQHAHGETRAELATLRHELAVRERALEWVKLHDCYLPGELPDGGCGSIGLGGCLECLLDRARAEIEKEDSK